MWRRWLMVVCGVLCATLLMGGELVASAGAARPASTAEELRQKAVAFAGGPQALGKVHTFSYDSSTISHRYGEIPEYVLMTVHHHAYDADKGLYRYESTLADFAKTTFWKDDHWTTDPNVPKGKQLIAVYKYPRLEGTVYIDGEPLSGDENMRLLRRVNDSVENCGCFAFLPLIVNNPSIHVDLAPPVKDDMLYGELEGFTAWSGTDKAKSKALWTLYLTGEGEVVRTDIAVRNRADPVTVYWKEWKQFGPVRVAQEHRIPQMNLMFRHERIELNKPLVVEPPK